MVEIILIGKNGRKFHIAPWEMRAKQYLVLKEIRTECLNSIKPTS